MTKTDQALAATPALIKILAARLLAKNLMLATAESCTGGGIAAALTDLAGSSAWFDAGFVTYSNAAKQRMLNVPGNLLAANGPGAVSEETVRAMTAGAITNSSADVAVAVSGVAGPEGGSPGKPVGTVWIGWQWGDMQRAQRFQFDGDRAAIRIATVQAGISGLLELLGE
jgi:nicotinamide-nucleotide amidase